MVMSYSGGDFTWPVNQPCTKSLTSLFLTRSNVNEMLLSRILALTPNLKCLEYEICDVGLHRPISLCAEGLGRALAHVKPTLEHLTISVWSYRSGGDPLGILSSVQGSLSPHEYESLVMLEIPTVVLLGKARAPEKCLASRLPPRMRRLYLNGDVAFSENGWTSRLNWRPLFEHLSQYREQSPDLESLKLDCKLDREDEELQDEAWNLFKELHLTPELV